MSFETFNESAFRSKVSRAQTTVKTILDNHRNPQLPEGVPHTYNDKYLLSEFLTNSSAAALFSCLEELGVDDSQLKKIRSWATKRSITLRLKAEESCTFVKQESRKVESSSYNSGWRKDKVITRIDEWFWKFEVKYEIFIFRGNKQNDGIPFVARTAECELVTTSEVTPHPKNTVRDSLDVNLSWLFNHMGEDNVWKFAIDRSAKACHTPRRNPEAQASLLFFNEVRAFAEGVRHYFQGVLFPVQPRKSKDLNLSSITDSSIFVPVAPLFEKAKNRKAAESTKGSKSLTTVAPVESEVLPVGLLPQFLVQQRRTLTAKFAELAKEFPLPDASGARLITMVEAKVVVLMMHLKQVVQAHLDGLNYIEDQLRKQLISAIGKEVTPRDLTAYMEFHNRKLYKEEYQPKGFSYAIRRPEHYPEGVINIDYQWDSASMPNPIPTIVSASHHAAPFKFALDASTDVTFHGSRYVHGWVNHQFSGSKQLELFLNARARQFSSFILMVGNIAGPTLFAPTAAIIIQNKDDLRIPLNMETIPSAKEFKAAISSLSPEQQRFSKAIRAMQLESTLFAIGVIQIKPQLEKVLNLPNDSLTKEIKLSQDLLNLFLEYQIPSSQLSYDGEDPNATVQERLAVVKKYVGAMNKVIQGEKDKEIEEARLKYELEHPQLIEPIVDYDDDIELQISPLDDEIYQEAPSSSSSSLFDSVLNLFGSKKKMNASPQYDMMSLGSASALSDDFISESGSAPSFAKMKKKKSRAPTQNKMKLAKIEAEDVSSMSKTMSSPSREMSPSLSAAPSKEMALPESDLAPEAEPEPEPEPEVTEKNNDDIAGDKDDGEIEGDGEVLPVDGDLTSIDYTQIPTQLETQFEQLDEDGALRPTILSPGTTWTLRSKKALLADYTTETLHNEQALEQKAKAFNLLDALTRSGVLEIDQAELHIVIASTHCFDKTLVNTVVQDNANPIEKIERSSLIVARTIHDTSVANLVADSQLDRISDFNPQLLLADSPAIAEIEENTEGLLAVGEEEAK